MRRIWIWLAILTIAATQISTADTIDFEPLEDAMWQDNMELPGWSTASYDVRFGVDLDADGTIDHPARLELRGNDPVNAYTLGPDTDDSDLSVLGGGGNWLLRRPKNGEPGTGKNLEVSLLFFYELETPELVQSITGEVWDVDLEEIYSVTLLDSENEVLGEVTLGPGSEAGAGKPTEFSFSGIQFPSTPRMRVSALSVGDAGGYGIDNLQVLYVPEPYSATLAWLFTIPMLLIARGRARSCHRRTVAAGTLRSSSGVALLA